MIGNHCPHTYVMPCDGGWYDVTCKCTRGELLAYRSGIKQSVAVWERKEGEINVNQTAITHCLILLFALRDPCLNFNQFNYKEENYHLMIQPYYHCGPSKAVTVVKSWLHFESSSWLPVCSDLWTYGVNKSPSIQETCILYHSCRSIACMICCLIAWTCSQDNCVKRKLIL